MSTYEAWRATHQDAEAAAKAAFEQVQGLAKMVDSLQGALGRQVRFGSVSDAAAAELRRLHAENQELKEQMAAIGAGGVEPLRKAARTPKDWLAVVPTLSPDFAVQVPPFTSLAQHKLIALLSQGFQITGYTIERADIADWAPQRGFVTHGGLVGWWTPHQIDRTPEAQHGQPT